MDTLFGLIPLSILLGLLGGLSWFIIAKHSDKIWVGKLSNPITTYATLIGWSIFGFLTNLDYNQDRGCMFFAEPIFSTANIFYSATAIGLLSLGVFISKQTIGKILLTCELLFWLYKLTLVKGGYAVGFGGVPSISVLAFDAIALTLRLFLIKQICQVNIKALFLFMITLLIMTLKIQFFR